MKPRPGRRSSASEARGRLYRSAVARLWTAWRARPRPVVLHPYVDEHDRWSRAARFLTLPALGLFCLVYGFFFAATAPYLILPLSAPLAVLALLVVWALPESSAAPTRVMEVFFSALLISLALWPNYLALTLPGTPWITMIRLTGLPMAFFLLISLSISPAFRRQVADSARGAPPILGLLIAFSANSLVSLPFSHHIGTTINQIIVQQVNWTGVFLVSLYVFRKPGRARNYATLFLTLAIPLAVVATIEFEEQHLLWAGNIPAFLRIDDPTAQLALESIVRSATGRYRAKATFSVPLGLAEFMSLLTPFALHWAVSSRTLPSRLFGLAMLPVIYVVVRMTDARLGVLGYLFSILVYVLIWSLVRWRHRLGDIVSATIVYAYPAAFLGVLAASLFVHKIHVLLFGGGAQAASNEHRADQFRMALPGVLHNPLGHGAAQAGLAMGYKPGDFIAIDSYYIALALDYGVLGVILYVAMFVTVIAAAMKTLLRVGETEDRDIALLVPLAACLSAFLMVRAVYAQPDIHPMIFAILGMAASLAARARSRAKPRAGPGAAPRARDPAAAAATPSRAARPVEGVH